MENLASRVADFDNTLSGFKAESNPSREMAAPYNAIVEAAKSQLPDDPIVQALEPTETIGPNCVADAGTMRTALNQILGALDT